MYQPYPGGAQTPEPSPQPLAPVSVQRAVKVMYAGAVASLIGIIIDLTMLSSLKSDIQSRNHNLTPAQVNTAEHVAIGAFIASGLIGAALWIWMAQSCKGGKGWARTVSTVLFGLDTIGQIGGASTGFTGSGSAGRIYSLLVWLIGLVAIILLWQRESSAFFKKTPRY